MEKINTRRHFGYINRIQSVIIKCFAQRLGRNCLGNYQAEEQAALASWQGSKLMHVAIVLKLVNLVCCKLRKLPNNFKMCLPGAVIFGAKCLVYDVEG